MSSSQPQEAKSQGRRAGLPALLVLLVCALLTAGARAANPPPDPAKPPGGNFDLSRWYLGTPALPQSTSISAAELMAGYNNSWFYTGTNGAMVFWCPVNGGYTTTATYPRSELREQINPPDNSVNWTAFGTHILEARCKVTVLPSSGKVIIGQIHGYLGAARPLLKLVFNSGKVDAQVKESPSADGDLTTSFPNVPLNREIAYRIELTDGLLTITINGVSHTEDLFSNDDRWADQTFYFKAGAYVQDNSGPSTEGGQIEFYQLNVNHTNRAPAHPVLSKQPASQTSQVGSNVVLNVSVTGGLPLVYRWYKDGVPIPGATLSILPLSNLQPADAGSYHAVISNQTGRVISAPATLQVLNGVPIPTLAEALDTTNLTWTTSGAVPWIGVFGAAHDGLDHARSGAMADNEANTLQTTVTGPGTLSFWWKVFSVTNDDILTLTIGSTEQARISGQSDWQARSFNIPAGSQVVKWTYQKGPVRTIERDQAWLDEVRFGPQPATITTQPTSQSVDQGANVTFNVTAAGPPPLSYQWLRNGVPLADGPGVRGATSSSLVLSNVQPALAGSYSAIVGNAAGAVVSSNAALAVNIVISLTDALDGTNLVWTTSGTPPWTGQSLVTHDGADAAQSGAIGHSGSASVQTAVTGPGTLGFWWKVSSQTNKDILRFYIGSSETAVLSGEIDWRRTNFSIPPGSHTLRWTYSKNSSTVAGQDRAWLDEVFYERLAAPAAPGNLIATPVSMSRIDLAWADYATNESSYCIERSTNGGTTFMQIAALGANSTTFASTGLLAGTTFAYRVRATNAAGSSAYTDSVAVPTLPFTSAKINFQPASAPVPPGYFADGGLAYGNRGNGLVYGWGSARESSATDRNSALSPDQRHDTFISSSKSTGIRWEIAVPNGPYTVFLVAGDAGSSSGLHRYSVEGRAAIDGSASSASRWLSNRVTVIVADGRLSLSNLAGASNNKICFLDIARPVVSLACAPDKTAECGSGWSFDAPAPVADPCTGSGLPVAVFGTATNSISSCSYTVTRVWQSVDGCGTTNTCSQTVTVVDTIAPTLACATDKMVECGTPWAFDPPANAEDRCSGANVTVIVASTITNRSGFCGGAFAATRIWSATDACGNSNTCSQTVTVVDTTSPMLVCATNKTAECGSDWVFNAPAVASGDCSGSNEIVAVVSTLTNDAGFCAGSFTVTRTWSATDACGNSNICSQTVTVADTTAPALVCSADKLVEFGSEWDFDEPISATDNGVGTNVTLAVISTLTNAPGPCEGTFTAVRTWSATDGCGNSNTCSQSVTVLDTTPPLLACAPDRVIECGTPWTFTEPVANDPSSAVPPVVTIVSTMTNALCGSSFLAARTWSALDACGNISLCTQSVTVVDTTPPDMVCPPSSTIVHGTDWSFDAPVTSDSCDGTNVVLTILGTLTNTLCGTGFSATRFWSAMDSCGNSNTCSQTVTVVDVTPPSITCLPSQTVEAGTPWTFGEPTVMDPDGDISPSVVVVSTSTNTQCGSSFTATRTWSATNPCGNSNSCSQTVTVVDTTPPDIACSAARSIEQGTEWSFDPPVAVDLADGTNVTLSIVSTTTNALCGNTFTATRTWSATDGCGNSSSCSQMITVLDTTPPAIHCGDIVACDPIVVLAPIASDVGEPHPQVSCLRNDGRAVAEPFAVGTTTVICTATDACGNSNACSFTVTVLAPGAASGPADQTVFPGSDVVLATTASGTGPLSYVWKFNGAIIDGATGDTLVLSNVQLAAAGTYCVEITGTCTAITHCATLTILDYQIGFCIADQADYADTNGQIHGLPTLQLLADLLGSEPLTVGKAGVRSVTINLPDLLALAARLPAAGAATGLSGDNADVPLAMLPLNLKGKFDNELLGQTLTLALNCRLDTNLVSFVPTDLFCSRFGGSVLPFRFSGTVLGSLTSLNDLTVGGLLELANRGLAGLPTDGASLSEIHEAVEAINAAFAGCGLLVTCSATASLVPVNDRFAVRSLLSGPVSSDPPGILAVFARTVGATVEPVEPVHAATAGGKSVWWQWTPLTSGPVQIRTAGSSFDTLLAVYTGSALDQLMLVSANDDDGVSVWSHVTFNAVAGMPYQIAVDGYLGGSGTVILTISEVTGP